MMQREELMTNATPAVLLNIKAKIVTMRPAQRKIAEYVLTHFHEVASISSAQLALASGVSKATLTRFVHDIGYANYHAFQIECARSQKGQAAKSMVYPEVSENDSTEGVCRKVFEGNIQALIDMTGTIDYTLLDDVAERIKSARNVYVFAVGRSAVSAASLINRFYRFGITCFLYSDSHTIAVASSLATKDDLAIGISTFGRTRPVLRGMERARENGATVVGLSSFKGTPMDRYADIMLYSVMNRLSDHDFEPSCETITQILLIDCLYMLLIVKMKDRVDRLFVKSQTAIDEEREWTK